MDYDKELDFVIAQVQQNSNIPEYFINLCANKKNKRSKKKSVGILGDDFYSLYVRAFNLTPVILNGGSFYTGENASHIFPQISDPVAKATLGTLYEHELEILKELDAVIVSATNDSYKKIIYHLERYNVEIIKVDPPSFLLTKMPLSYISQQLGILNKLSKINNSRLSYKRLKQELKSYKQAHLLISSEKWKAISTFTQDFLLHTLYIDENKETWCKEMQKYLDTIEAKPSYTSITLIGSPIRFPTSKIYQIFQDIGITHFSNKCLTLPEFHGIPLRKFAFAQLNECFKYQYKKSFSARALADFDDFEFSTSTKAIIYYLLKGQMAEAYEAEQIEKLAIKKDIPFLCIETDYTNSDNEQIKIRLEAFYEMIKSKKI